jgi:N-acetylneuraminic acid mutarotase
MNPTETKACRRLSPYAFAIFLLLLSNHSGLSQGCDDEWKPTNTLNTPTKRFYHVAVWTGTEMIVWGGLDPSTGLLNGGARYNPSSDTWTSMSTANAPSGRELSTAVWTGTEMIVWGGVDGANNALNTGGRYNPANDTWTQTSLANAPIARDNHTAVWTGSGMIVWGGIDAGGTRLDTGGIYNPATDTWTTISTTNAPKGRATHSAVWTGSEMIVWGGQTQENCNPTCVLKITSTGGRYNPSSDTWTATDVSNAPAPRYGHTAVWTGSEMIVFGGRGSNGVLNATGRYEPATDSWLPVSTSNEPAARENHTAVWTGTQMIVWGGDDGHNAMNTGGRYEPHSYHLQGGIDFWIGTSLTNAPSGRYRHTAVWTTAEMIVWGGEASFSNVFDTGARYCASAFLDNINSIQFAGKDIEIQFDTVSGYSYRVETTNNLVSPAWVTLASGISGTGSTVTFTDSGALASHIYRYYRIVQQ